MITYTDKELQKAKNVLEACESLKSSTKGCYSSRIALWMHFCNQHCNGNDLVTDQRLADYVEWLIESGAAERIRQGPTHIQQVLRIQLQGVMCYWNIQNRNNEDARDPRHEPLFIEKWQQISMRFPYPQHTRRSQPIYGAHGMATPARGPDSRSQPPNTAPHSGYMSSDGSPSRGQSMGMRPQHILPNGTPARAIAPSPAMPNGSSYQPARVDPAHAGYPQNMPRQNYSQPSSAYGSRPMGHQAPPGHHPYTNGSPAYPRDAPPAYNQPQVPPRAVAPTSLAPSTSLAPLAPRLAAAVPSKPSYPTSMQSLAPLPDSSRVPSRSGSIAQSLPSGSAMDNEPVQRIDSRQSLPLEAGAHQTVDGRSTDNIRYSRATSIGVSSQLDATLVSAPASPRPKPRSEQPRSGALPEQLPIWEGEAADASAAAPEGHLLTANEALALSIRLLGASNELQAQVHAHAMLGLATWIPAGVRSTLTLADLAMDESLGAESSAQNEGGSAEQIHKAISIALNPTDTDASSAKDNKAIALRHANPLLCAWGTLAMWLFSWWHVANETTPDLNTAEWQSQRLFPGIAAGPEAADAGFQHLVNTTLSEISNDKIDGALAMSDVSFFYAEAFGLVKPTVAGIKGLGTVDAVNAKTLLPEVLQAVARANAGYSANTADAIQTPKRFEVLPSQSLLKEVFPWLKTMLIDAFKQNTNNDDVQVVRRIIQVLRELRVVLLQDVAFLMEIPALADAVKSNPLFEHKLFSSSEFVAFREEMRGAVGEDEIKRVDALCTSAFKWVDERRESMPEGSADRMKATAPIRTSPSPTPAPPSNGSTDAEGNHKRLRDSDGPFDIKSADDAAMDGAESSASPKRIRRVYEMITGPPAGRIFGSTSAEVASSTPGAIAQAPANDALATGSARALEDLRKENDDLKAQLRRLEWVLSQHKAEVRTWMVKIEKSVREINLNRPSMTPPTEQPQRYYSGAPGAGHPGTGMQKVTPQRSQMVAPAGMPPHEMSPQPRRYAPNHYQMPPPAQAGAGHHPMGPPQAGREGMIQYERPMHPAVDYRTADPAAPSPRSQAYGSRLPPGPEYADPRYAGHHNGAYSHQHPQANGYEPADRAWYSKGREPGYPSGQPSSMAGAQHPGAY